MMVGSFLALSIQRSTVCFFGNSRTRLRLLASRIFSTKCSGLRNLSSLTVLTPTARSSSEYSQPMPLTRMRSAAVTQPRMRSELVPVISASLSRCFGVLAERRSPMVVRIPSDLRIAAVSGPMPRMSVIGYAIGASPAPRSNGLQKAGDGRRGEHIKLRGGMSADVAADSLYLPHAQPRRHHAHARAHCAAHGSPQQGFDCCEPAESGGALCDSSSMTRKSEMIPTVFSAAIAIYSEIGDK